VYNTISVEELGKPAVLLVNEGFAQAAETARSARGLPGMRFIPEKVPPQSNVFKDIEAGITAAIDDIIAALTKPLTDAEKHPKAKEVQTPPRFIFKGNLEEVNHFFYKRGWGDGLPIIPPTEAAVAEMMKGTDLPPDHLVAKVVPRMGKATVEKIAVNAVMAGALPTYMPLLITGVQVLVDPKANFAMFGVSTGSWSPFWIINGPVRNALKINSGVGTLSPGNIANATIGRAINLIAQNIGGARTGLENMEVHGNAERYSQVMAEDEENNPWEPLQVEHGFKKEDSTMSLFFPNCTNRIVSYGTDAKGVLNSIIYNLIPGRRGRLVVLLPPGLAKTVAEQGWNKKEIARFISDFARVPIYRTSFALGTGYPPKEMNIVNHLETIPIISDPDMIRILVAGGSGVFISLYAAAGAVGGTDWITKIINLPPNWDALVKKYKDIVPNYLQY
jgi:hypothetical protein